MNYSQLDEILKFILTDENINSYVSTHDIRRELLKELNPDQINRMLEFIQNYDDNIASFQGGGHNILIGSTGLTQEFLDNGGFTKLAANEKKAKDEKEQKDSYKEDLEISVKELQKEGLIYQQTIRDLEEELKISSLIKNYWYLIGGCITIGIAIGAVLV